MKSPIDIAITTRRLATGIGSTLSEYNTGAYWGTDIPLRKMSGSETVRVVGSTAGAAVVGDDWIADRFGGLGARQIKKLLAYTKKSTRAKVLRAGRRRRGYATRRRT